MMTTEHARYVTRSFQTLYVILECNIYTYTCADTLNKYKLVIQSHLIRVVVAVGIVIVWNLFGSGRHLIPAQMCFNSEGVVFPLVIRDHSFFTIFAPLGARL